MKRKTRWNAPRRTAHIQRVSAIDGDDADSRHALTDVVLAAEYFPPRKRRLRVARPFRATIDRYPQMPHPWTTGEPGCGYTPPLPVSGSVRQRQFAPPCDAELARRPTGQHRRPGKLGVQQDQHEHRQVSAAKRALTRAAVRESHRREQPAEPGHRRQRIRRDAKGEQRGMTRQFEPPSHRQQEGQRDQGSRGAAHPTSRSRRTRAAAAARRMAADRAVRRPRAAARGTSRLVAIWSRDSPPNTSDASANRSSVSSVTRKKRPSV